MGRILLLAPLFAFVLGTGGSVHALGKERNGRAVESSICAKPTNARTDRWYACTSAWNTPIPPDPPIAPDSTEIITAHWIGDPTYVYRQWLHPIGPGLGAAPVVAYATPSTRRVTVQINFPKCASRFVRVPIPSGTVVQYPPDQLSTDRSANENKLALMLPDGDEWDFDNITNPGWLPYSLTGEGQCAANAYWQAEEGQIHGPSEYPPGKGWTGSGSDRAHWSDSGVPWAAGVIRRIDLADTPVGGNWGHALQVIYSGNCSRNQSYHPAYVYPATSSDGTNTDPGCAPMGARFQLDPSIDCRTWPSLAKQREWMKQECRTLQVYGAISVHSASCMGCGDGVGTEFYANLGSYKYPWADAATGAWPDYYGAQLALPDDLMSHFRVIDWTKWTGLSKRS